MKKTHIFPVVIILMGAGFLIYNLMSGIKRDRRLPVGASLPEITVRDIDREIDIKTSDLKGKVLLINFWATWCKPCIDEMPYLDSLYRRMKENPGFKMLTLAFNDDPKNCRTFAQQLGYGIPVFSDPLGRTAAQFGITGVPETFIVDKTGTIRKVKIGPERWDSPGNISLILSLLKE